MHALVCVCVCLCQFPAVLPSLQAPITPAPLNTTSDGQRPQAILNDSQSGTQGEAEPLQCKQEDAIAQEATNGEEA